MVQEGGGDLEKGRIKKKLRKMDDLKTIQLKFWLDQNASLEKLVRWKKRLKKAKEIRMYLIDVTRERNLIVTRELI